MLDYLKKIKLNKTCLIFTLVLLITGFLTGLLMGFPNKLEMETSLIRFANNIQGVSVPLIFSRFSFLCFAYTSSLFVIGIPALLIFFFFEGFITGFLFASFGAVFHFKGFLFGLIFLIVVNGFFIIGSLLIFIKALELARSIISHIIYKKDNEKHILNTLIKGLAILFILGLNDLFLYFTSSPLLNFFRFLLS